MKRMLDLDRDSPKTDIQIDVLDWDYKGTYEPKHFQLMRRLTCRVSVAFDLFGMS